MIDEIPQAAVEALHFYVYRLVDPSNDETFYIGKGFGQRAFHHARAATRDDTPSDRLDRIREVISSGQTVKIVIHRHGMDEITALEVEAALIDAFPALTNLASGHGVEFGAASLAELVERYAARPAEIQVPAMLIRIEREWHSNLTSEQLYERTRRYWVCNPHKRRPSPTHAISIGRSLIREIYRISKWESYKNWPADRDLTRLDSASGAWTPGQVRRGFIGEVDADLSRLRGCSVRHFLKAGAQNPISYVNC